MQKLIGKRIDALYMAGPDLVLLHDDGDFSVLTPEGDGCLRATINHISGAYLAPCVITGIVEKEGRTEHDNNGDQVDTGFYSLATDKGFLDIELRVEHNGYYGGELRLRGSNYFGLVDQSKWALLKEDF